MAQTPLPAALNETIPPDIGSLSSENSSGTFNDVLQDAQQRNSNSKFSTDSAAEIADSEAQEVPSANAGTADVDESAEHSDSSGLSGSIRNSSEDSEAETPLGLGENGERLALAGDLEFRQSNGTVSGNSSGASVSNAATNGDLSLAGQLNSAGSAESLHTDQSILRAEGASNSNSSASANTQLTSEDSHRVVTQPGDTSSHGRGTQTGISAEAASYKDGAIRLDQGFRSVDASQNQGADRAASTQAASANTGSPKGSKVASAASMHAEKVNAEILKMREGASTGDQAVISKTTPGGEAAGDGLRGLVVPVPSRGISAGNAQQLPTTAAESAQNQIENGPPETLRGVSKGLSVLAQQRGGSLKMRLDPPSLGTVRLEMSVEAGRVSVQIAAASDSARALLQGNLGMLRTALEERGLAVDRLAVDSTAKSIGDGTARSDARESGEHGTRGGDREESRQDASQGRSRGRREHDGEQRWVQDGTDGKTDFEDILLGA